MWGDGTYLTVAEEAKEAKEAIRACFQGIAQHPILLNDGETHRVNEILKMELLLQCACFSFGKNSGRIFWPRKSIGFPRSDMNPKILFPHNKGRMLDPNKATEEQAPTVSLPKTSDSMEKSEGDSHGGSSESASFGTIPSSTQNDGTTGKGRAEKADTEIAGRENRNVFCLRMIVLFCLLGSTIGVAVGVHRYVAHGEQMNFETQFHDDSKKVLDNIGSTLAITLGSVDEFLVSLVSFANATNSSWPYVTLPDYAVRVAKLRSLSKAVLVTQYQYVTGPQRAEWEAYTATHHQWLQNGIDVQEADATYHGLIVHNYTVDNHIYANSPSYNSSGPYLPKWQQSPVIPLYPPYNWDAMTYPSLANALPVVQGDRNIALSDVSNIATNASKESLQQVAGNNAYIKDYIGPNENPAEPFGDIYFPMLDYADKYVMIPKNVANQSSLGNFVGVFAMTFFWRDLMTDILPRESHGIVVVITNTCGQSFTYRIDGTHAIFLGPRDAHETKYNSYVRSSDLIDLNAFTAGLSQRTYTGLDLSNKGCQYHISIYPSTAMEDSIKNKDPITFSAVAVAIFVFTSLIFICYDYMVERRQAKVMETAVHTNAIVASLFPSNVRDRLFNTADTARSTNEPSRMLEHNKTRLKTFLSSDVRQNDSSPFQSTVTSSERASGPIADLFPNCTVQFCDICGFTAWSSVREPSQVFTLLETLYGAFDSIAMRRGVFKVETIGDSYVAVCGLPEPRADHAVVMAKFSRDCLLKASEVFRKLEKSLGPGTGDLRLRFGLNSGAVTAGVLRGQKSRFQLFGDTVNTAARMESTGRPNKVQVSPQTAELLVAAGKDIWMKRRDELVEAKGKGSMQTFWLELRMMGSHMAAATTTSEVSNAEHRQELDEHTDRLVEWNHDILSRLLKQIVATRNVLGKSSAFSRRSVKSISSTPNGSVIDEVCEIIELPDFNAEAYLHQGDPDEVQLEEIVDRQLRDYIIAIAAHYNDNAFHCFDHASHVGMSTAKLLSRIIKPEEVLASGSMPKEQTEIGRVLHEHTFGITSDPLTQFACVFSALVHDADHPGVPNSCLVQEKTPLAVQYQDKSVAEQHSVDLAWNLLMTESYKELRQAICPTSNELKRLRQLVVNIVMATDIMDRDLIKLRNCRWEKAFSEDTIEEGENSNRDKINRKATIVLEHLIQASDVAHTMQHWHIYQKWNERLFREMYAAYKAGRAEKNPADFWYHGELGFLDNYVIPLAKKLRNCGVFGVSSDEYLTYAIRNREEFALRGHEVVASMLEKLRQEELQPQRQKSSEPGNSH